MSSEQDRERARRYYERHRAECNARNKAWREQKGTKLQIAQAKGPQAVEELRRKNREHLARRRLKRRGPAAPQRGPNSPKLIVEIPPAEGVTESARKAHPDLGWLVDHIGAIAVRRLRHRSEARRDFAVWNAARASLPARPVAAEFSLWLAALEKGEHGGIPLSLATLRNVYFRVAALYDTAKMLGKLGRNPMREVPEPKPQGPGPGAYSWRVVIEGFERLLAATSDWRERAFFTVFRYTGLRVSEVLGLRREHIILLPGGQVKLQLETQRARSGTVTGSDAPLKHDRQRRVLPLNGEALISALLRARRETPSLVRTRDAMHRPSLAQSPYLFPFSTTRVAELEKRLHAVLPELPAGVGWHAFRHAYSAEATLVARVAIDDLSQWLGHSSSAVTRTYLRSLLGEQPDLDSFSLRVAAAQLRKPLAAPVPIRQHKP